MNFSSYCLFTPGLLHSILHFLPLFNAWKEINSINNIQAFSTPNLPIVWQAKLHVKNFISSNWSKIAIEYVKYYWVVFLKNLFILQKCRFFFEKIERKNQSFHRRYSSMQLCTFFWHFTIRITAFQHFSFYLESGKFPGVCGRLVEFFQSCPVWIVTSHQRKAYTNYTF